MTAQIIDGKAIAQQVRAEWKVRADALKARGITPGLAAIIVGDNPASKVYVANKVKACAELGLYSKHIELGSDISEATLLNEIDALNNDPKIHGILVQLPLPKHLDTHKVIEAINPDKDVDGFHEKNVGALVTGETPFPSCTPYGVMVLLEKTGIRIEGKHRWQTDGTAAAAQECHSDDLYFQDRRSSQAYPRCRHTSRGSGQGQLHHRRYGQARCGGDRCWYQSEHGRQADR